MYASTVVACGSWVSILPVSWRNSSSVTSLVQHWAEASLVSVAGVNGWVHLAASSGMARMSVVVCRSHCECRQTSARSAVKVTSHSWMPAPITAAAM